jgi:hypothetical protein
MRKTHLSPQRLCVIVPRTYAAASCENHNSYFIIFPSLLCAQLQCYGDIVDPAQICCVDDGYYTFTNKLMLQHV